VIGLCLFNKGDSGYTRGPNPAPHTHASARALPAGESEFAPQVVHGAVPVTFLYFPATHAAHGPPSGPLEPAAHAPAMWHVALDVAPTASEYQPALQLVHAEAAVVVEYVPAAQAVHVASAEAAVVVEYVPAAQAVHVASAEAPVSSEYLPATQAVHVASAEAPSSIEYLPATQAVHAVAPFVVVYFPVSQSKQNRCAVRMVYFPTSQAVHVAAEVAPTASEYLPGTQEVHASEPFVVEYLPAVQSEHVTAEVAPVSYEYLPAAQAVHGAVPVTLLYFPATHAAHGPPSGPLEPAAHAPAMSHVALDVAPTASEDQPALQFVHAAVPATALYFPAGHAAHAFPAGHVVSVRSKPPVISAAIAVSVAAVMYSSTKKKPAMSPLKPKFVEKVDKYTIVDMSGIVLTVHPPIIDKSLI